MQEFINNSKATINFDMDVNLNNIVEPLELGWQLWQDGELIHWICYQVPSPFYVYTYNCGLSGNIPSKISELSSLIKLHLQYNKLSGAIPSSICDLDISKTSDYWFKINHNNLCPPYPSCLQSWNINQNKKECN